MDIIKHCSANWATWSVKRPKIFFEKIQNISKYLEIFGNNFDQKIIF